MLGHDLDDLDLVASAGGTRLRLRVKAGGRRNGLDGVRAGALRVSVTAAPEKGRANKAVLRVLATALDIAPSSIELLTGHGSSDKAVRVPLSPAEVRAALGSRGRA